LPNVKSAEKRMRQSRVRAARNRQFRSTMRTALKKVRTADTVETADSAFRTASALLDRAASKRIIHPNKANRTKSRLSGWLKEKGLQQA
jgi:small subunit ribosomal protein S20